MEIMHNRLVRSQQTVIDEVKIVFTLVISVLEALARKIKELGSLTINQVIKSITIRFNQLEAYHIEARIDSSNNNF
jgi:hypothetical protein